MLLLADLGADNVHLTRDSAFKNSASIRLKLVANFLPVTCAKFVCTRTLSVLDMIVHSGRLNAKAGVNK